MTRTPLEKPRRMPLHEKLTVRTVVMVYRFNKHVYRFSKHGFKADWTLSARESNITCVRGTAQSYYVSASYCPLVLKIV